MFKEREHSILSNAKFVQEERKTENNKTIFISGIFCSNNGFISEELSLFTVTDRVMSSQSFKVLILFMENIASNY